MCVCVCVCVCVTNIVHTSICFSAIIHGKCFQNFQTAKSIMQWHCLLQLCCFVCHISRNFLFLLLLTGILKVLFSAKLPSVWFTDWMLSVVTLYWLIFYCVSITCAAVIPETVLFPLYKLLWWIKTAMLFAFTHMYFHVAFKFKIHLLETLTSKNKYVIKYCNWMATSFSIKWRNECTMTNELIRLNYSSIWTLEVLNDIWQNEQ